MIPFIVFQAASKGIENVHQIIGREAEIIKKFLPNFTKVDFNVTTLRLDSDAEIIIKSCKIAANMLPIRETPNGNCLFNAVSLCLCGSEKLAIYLKMDFLLPGLFWLYVMF